MTIVYRTDGAWGLGKGSNLTPAEVDGNFYFLDQRVSTLLDGLLPAGIDTISMTGAELTFVLDDVGGTTFGPFTIPPAALRWRGDFAGATSYLKNDIISHETGIYLVLQAHTSDAEFDGARQVSGLPVYEVMLAAEGGAGQIGISKVITTASTTYNPDPADDKAYIRFTSTPDIIVPDDATLDLPIGWSMMMRKVGALGQITIFEEAIATINVPTGFFNTVILDGGVATLIKVAPNEWDLFGDLEAS